ncbi:hypothetical protein PLANPX_3846 [Lacipirellula parvula]|uniref:Uncharacterized protein n=1 Tax=Lacipirellula parvula TaxID=2650471 RepID=A0A5K7XBP4_9BACT|nr:hypothetical protein PLANPX_3846 [Lacipirellula parvula]
MRLASLAQKPESNKWSRRDHDPHELGHAFSLAVTQTV